MRYKGAGILNRLINKLPVELHIPGYQYCGPGTKLQKRLARGDPGRNPLDVACKEHDIAYGQSDNLQDRHAADRILLKQAIQRLKAGDGGERTAAGLVTFALGTKLALGAGMKRRKPRTRRKRRSRRKPRKVRRKNRRK